MFLANKKSYGPNRISCFVAAAAAVAVAAAARITNDRAQYLDVMLYLCYIQTCLMLGISK
jgi:hypothetical protein